MSVFIKKLAERQQNSASQKVWNNNRLTEFASSNLGASAKNSKAYDITNLGGSQPMLETNTGLRLVDRYLEQDVVDDLFSDTKVLTLGRFLAAVAPPKFEPPTSNFVVVGILIRKPEQYETPGKKRFASMVISDLEYEMRLSVNGTGLQKYLAMRPGTMIAILNPNIIPSPKTSPGLTLSIQSSKSSLIELGHSRDFGQCVGVKSDSKSRCKNWVDLRRTHVCDYHQRQDTFRAMSSRPEFNSTVVKLTEPKAHGEAAMTLFSGGRVRWLNGLQEDTQSPDVSSGNIYSMGRQDRSGYDNAVLDERVVAKRKKRRQETLENESRIRKKLAQRDGGFMLREFDEKGRLIEDEEVQSTQDDTTLAFKPEFVRRLGFNPAKTAPKLANSANNRPKAPTKPREPTQSVSNNESDDDLVIV